MALLKQAARDSEEAREMGNKDFMDLRQLKYTNLSAKVRNRFTRMDKVAGYSSGVTGFASRQNEAIKSDQFE